MLPGRSQGKVLPAAVVRIYRRGGEIQPVSIRVDKKAFSQNMEAPQTGIVT